MLKRTRGFVQPIRVVAAGNAFAIFAADAGIAQLVERQLPKLNVAGSNPVARSTRRFALWPWPAPDGAPASDSPKGARSLAWTRAQRSAPAARGSSLGYFGRLLAPRTKSPLGYFAETPGAARGTWVSRLTSP